MTNATSTALDMPVRYTLHSYGDRWDYTPSVWDSVQDDYVPTTDHLRHILTRWLLDTNRAPGTYALQAWGLDRLIDSVSVTV